MSLPDGKQARQVIGRLNFMANRHSLMEDARKLALGTVKTARNPETLRQAVEGMATVAELVEAETASWIEPDAIGQGGSFDACDLRHWLAIAERAGVPFIPARTVLTLSEDEIGAVSGPAPIPDKVSSAIRRGLIRAFGVPEVDTPRHGPDPVGIEDRLFAAMDDVPEGWMVRTNLSGSSGLKAFAGAGVLGDGREGGHLAEGIEVGAGWVRVGNRRRIDATDHRFISVAVAGHKPEIHYLARPWVQAARIETCEDPHRHGTPFAGKGEWPQEWRVFVRDGTITGVASYYGWVGSATPESAARALEAVSLAQRIVDEAVALSLAPRLMDMELLRRSPNAERQADILAAFPRDGVSCTLDFFEGVDGLTLLEGGPPHTPIGGAHPCAFAGHGVVEGRGRFCDCSGVALRMMGHVSMADPKTWVPGETAGHILSWDEARALAARCEEAPSP